MCAVALCVVASLSYLAVREDWVVPKEIGLLGWGEAENDSLQAKLLALKPGDSWDVADFRRAAGGSTLLTIREAEFFQGGIQPILKWRDPKRKVMIVNSVDHRQAPSGGLSGVLLKGCSVPDRTANMPDLKGGDLTNTPCGERSMYGARYGVTALANLVVVPWKGAGGVAPCFDFQGREQKDEDARQRCLLDSARIGLGKLFNRLRFLKAAERPDVLVVTAVGTDIGRLDKKKFYDMFAELFLAELAFKKSGLPKEVVLHVRANSDDELRANTASAIPDALSTIEAKWAPAEEHPAQFAFALLAATGVMLTVLLSATTELSPRWIGRVLPWPDAVQTRKQRFLYPIGWAMAAFGTASAVEKLFEGLASRYHFFSSATAVVLLGVAAAALSAMALSAADLYQKGSKGN